MRQQGQVEKLQTHSKIENTKRLKNNLRGTGFVLNATSKTLLTLENVGNAWVILKITQRKLIRHLRSRNPKKKRLSLTKFNSSLAQTIALGHASGATLKVPSSVHAVSLAKYQSKSRTSKSNKPLFVISVTKLETWKIN